MKVKRVEGGLLIPDEYLTRFGDLEVIVKPLAIIIKPKTLTQPIDCISTPRVETQNGEVTETNEQPSPLRRSSPRALLEFIEHSEGWKGDDLDNLLEEVYAIRGRF